MKFITSLIERGHGRPANQQAATPSRTSRTSHTGGTGGTQQALRAEQPHHPHLARPKRPPLSVYGPGSSPPRARGLSNALGKAGSWFSRSGRGADAREAPAPVPVQAQQFGFPYAHMIARSRPQMGPSTLSAEATARIEEWVRSGKDPVRLWLDGNVGLRTLIEAGADPARLLKGGADWDALVIAGADLTRLVREADDLAVPDPWRVPERRAGASPAQSAPAAEARPFQARPFHWMQPGQPPLDIHPVHRTPAEVPWRHSPSIGSNSTLDTQDRNSRSPHEMSTPDWSDTGSHMGQLRDTLDGFDLGFSLHASRRDAATPATSAFSASTAAREEAESFGSVYSRTSDGRVKSTYRRPGDAPGQPTSVDSEASRRYRFSWKPPREDASITPAPLFSRSPAGIGRELEPALISRWSDSRTDVTSIEGGSMNPGEASPSQEFDGLSQLQRACQQPFGMPAKLRPDLNKPLPATPPASVIGLRQLLDSGVTHFRRP